MQQSIDVLFDRATDTLCQIDSSGQMTNFQASHCSFVGNESGINIQSFEDKWFFLQYACPYVRRPPICAMSYHPHRGRNVTLCLQIEGSVDGLRKYSAPLRNSSTVGPNMFQNAVSMRFGALHCSLRGHSGEPQPPSLPF
jgi:hypothetical protein